MTYRKRRAVFVGAAVFLVAFLVGAGYFMDSTLKAGTISHVVQQMGISKNEGDNPYEITMVTLYVNIGSFQKGTGRYRYTPDMYKNWMKTWGWLTNRVIAFFDSDETINIFRTIRSSQPPDKTVIFKINRTDIPAFKKLDKVMHIFGTPGYPHHPPNTVYAEYSCATSAKYDAIKLALDMDLVHTRYLAWLDTGYFRHLLNPKFPAGRKPFTLEVPDFFNSSSVGMSEVGARDHLSKISPWEYVRDNQVWVAGGFSLGTKENMRKFSDSFTLTWNDLLRQNMSSTDQQVIGAMYSPAYIRHQKMDLVGYRCKEGQFGLYGLDLAYFCLGYASKEASENTRNTSKNSLS